MSVLKVFEAERLDVETGMAGREADTGAGGVSRYIFSLPVVSPSFSTVVGVDNVSAKRDMYRPPRRPWPLLPDPSSEEVSGSVESCMSVVRSMCRSLALLTMCGWLSSSDISGLSSGFLTSRSMIMSTSSAL